MDACSIGIIGGADGPTAVFVAGNPLPLILAAVGIAALLALLLRHFRKRK